MKKTIGREEFCRNERGGEVEAEVGEDIVDKTTDWNGIFKNVDGGGVRRSLAE